MRFNCNPYNLSKFNVGGGTESSGLRGMSKGTGRTLPAALFLRVRIYGRASGTGKTKTALLVLRIPLSAKGAGKSNTKTTLLCLRAPLQGAAQGASRTVQPALDVARTDYMQFTGINLRPGETLYIDTDKIRILRNGEDDIRGWGGGVFFKLSTSGNILTYSDNAKSRTLGVSVIWQDRWL